MNGPASGLGGSAAGMSEPMTDAELAEIEKKCAEAMASSDLSFTAPWVFSAVPALLAEVTRLKEENRKLQVEVIDWEARVRSEREACAKVAEADLEPQDGLVGAEQRFDGGASERAAKRIAAAIRARGADRLHGSHRW